MTRSREGKIEGKNVRLWLHFYFSSSENCKIVLGGAGMGSNQELRPSSKTWKVSLDYVKLFPFFFSFLFFFFIYCKREHK